MTDDPVIMSRLLHAIRQHVQHSDNYCGCGYHFVPNESGWDADDADEHTAKAILKALADAGYRIEKT